jgi:hypothetical protein
MSDCDRPYSEANHVTSSHDEEEDLFASIFRGLTLQQWRHLIGCARTLYCEAPLMIAKRQHALLSSMYTAMTQDEVDDFGERDELLRQTEVNDEGRLADPANIGESLSTESILCLFATLIDCIPVDAPQERATQLDRAVDLIAMSEAPHARSGHYRDDLKALIETYIRRLRDALIDQLINDVPPSLRASIRAHLSMI